MTRTRVSSAPLSEEQREEIRREFGRQGRSSKDADGFMASVPAIVEESIKYHRSVAANHATLSRMNRPSAKRQAKRFEASARIALTSLDEMGPEMWQVVTGLPADFGQNMRDGLEVICNTSMPGWEQRIAAKRPRQRPGKPPAYDVQMLFAALGVKFLESGFPLAMTSDGLFVSVARILHPAWPTSIKHAVIAEAVREARDCMKRREVARQALAGDRLNRYGRIYYAATMEVRPRRRS